MRDMHCQTFAYAPKAEQTWKETAHRYCAKCFQEKHKSILEFQGRTVFRQELYACPRCKTVFHLGNPRNPNPPSPRPYRIAFSYMSSSVDKRLLLATLIGAIGICLWATETVLVTFTIGLPTLEIVALAFAIASLLSPLAWKITGGSPLDAFRQPISVWLMTVPCLVLYHACIYYAVHRVPATPAALLHGATPLFIVLGSALLPGEHIRWWHLAGAGLGALGMFWLVDGGSGDLAVDADAAFYLACIGLAAGLWGIYSLLSRRFGDVPTSVMGTFYAAAALAAGIGHLTLETWVTPNTGQIVAIIALGLLPMGLALYCWDYGVKRGDIQALGATSYVEPLIGAFLVVAVGQGQLHWSMILAGMLIIGGSVLAAGSLWGKKPQSEIALADLHNSSGELVLGPCKSFGSRLA
jgi:drug/metabolite transporter (DMT)-like permease